MERGKGRGGEEREERGGEGEDGVFIAATKLMTFVARRSQNALTPFRNPKYATWRKYYVNPIIKQQIFV